MLNILNILLTHNSAYTVARIEELRAVNLKCNMLAFLSMSAEYLLKFDIIFQGSAATCLRWGGNIASVLYQISYAFQYCKNFENLLRFEKVTESLKVATFLRHSVHMSYNMFTLGCRAGGGVMDWSANSCVTSAWCISSLITTWSELLDVWHIFVDLWNWLSII